MVTALLSAAQRRLFVSCCGSARLDDSRRHYRKRFQSAHTHGMIGSTVTTLSLKDNTIAVYILDSMHSRIGLAIAVIYVRGVHLTVLYGRNGASNFELLCSAVHRLKAQYSLRRRQIFQRL